MSNFTLLKRDQILTSPKDQLAGLKFIESEPQMVIKVLYLTERKTESYILIRSFRLLHNNLLRFQSLRLSKDIFSNGELQIFGLRFSKQNMPCSCFLYQITAPLDCKYEVTL